MGFHIVTPKEWTMPVWRAGKKIKEHYFGLVRYLNCGVDHDSFQFENDLFESNLVKTAKVGEAMCMLLIQEICPKWQ